MINSEYYKNYKGPSLILAQIWKDQGKKENITDYVRGFYGKNNNWNGKLIEYSDIFPSKYNYHFYIEFQGDDKRKHWFYGTVGKLNTIFNSPLANPMNQNDLSLSSNK
tara:strand:+ start:67 stop:390 length:324 start_codon:yes stop_codon:yes gene_type:complete